ncbi:MAG: Unknown protein [uncultured Thiotrichaceae bacterium]|uniref:Uncharacterized protein n=1 Tax=uncultured Thiotrichaceae bacterium TaxID=298394 RepID=A0A6S6T8X2_9GAMM|nr:MAG: Unknown protein [uncultured Thiotrichaceae bacterium]
MNDKNNNNVKHQLGESLDKYKRETLRFYFQDVAPVFGRMSDVTDNPSHLRKLLPENKGLWASIALLFTIFMMLVAPEQYWLLQPIIFLFVFLFGHLVLTFLTKWFFDLRNLLVAYPGKHLLGQSIKLKTPLVNGEGEAQLYGETWTIVGEDCSSGTLVKVVAVDKGNLFVVMEEENG